MRSIHKPTLDMFIKSTKLCRGLSVKDEFVRSMIAQLTEADAMVLYSLLKIIELLLLNNPSPNRFASEYDLFKVVNAYAQSESQVLVNEAALSILQGLNK